MKVQWLNKSIEISIHSLPAFGENESIFHYKVDNYYNPKKEGSIAPNDPELGLDWLISERDWIQSDKDLNHPQLKDALLFDYKQNLYV